MGKNTLRHTLSEWYVDPTDTPFENVNSVRFKTGTYGNNIYNGQPPGGNGPPPVRDGLSGGGN